VITDFVITAVCHHVFSSGCAHSHLTTLLVKHWPIVGALRDVSQTVTHHTMTSVIFFMRICVPKVLNTINYIILPQLQVFNGKWMSLQQEIRPYVSGFPLHCCDHSSLMERDPKCNVLLSLICWAYILINEISEFFIFFLFCLNDGWYWERNTHQSKLPPLDLLWIWYWEWNTAVLILRSHGWSTNNNQIGVSKRASWTLHLTFLTRSDNQNLFVNTRTRSSL